MLLTSDGHISPKKFQFNILFGFTKHLHVGCEITFDRGRGVGRKTERWVQSIKEGHCKIGADKQHTPLRNITWHMDMPQVYFIKKNWEGEEERERKSEISSSTIPRGEFYWYVSDTVPVEPEKSSHF